MILLLFALVSVVTSATCGDGECSPSESTTTCSTDCPYNIHVTHPRLYFTPDDIARFSTRRDKEIELIIGWPPVQRTANTYKTSYSTKAAVHDLVNTPSQRYSAIPMHLALVGAVTNDTVMIDICHWFVDELLLIPDNFGDDYNQGSKIESLAYIYDYLFASLNLSTRAQIRTAIASQLRGPNLWPMMSNPLYTAGHSHSVHFRTTLGMVAVYGDGQEGLNTTWILRMLIDHYLSADGFIDTYDYVAADGGHFFGPAYGGAYYDPAFEFLWDTATDEAPATRPWLRKAALWYIYNIRHWNSKDRNYPIFGDTWDHASAESQLAMAWAAKNWKTSEYLAWFVKNKAHWSDLGVWGLVGNFNEDGTIQDHSPNHWKGVSSDSTWLADGGVDGLGAYEFNGGLGVGVLLFQGLSFPQAEGTVAFWVRGQIFNLSASDGLIDQYYDRSHLFIRCTGHYVQYVAQIPGSYRASIGVSSPFSLLLFPPSPSPFRKYSSNSTRSIKPMSLSAIGTSSQSLTTPSPGHSVRSWTDSRGRE